MLSLYTGPGICVYYLLPRQSLKNDLYLLVQLEKWRKIQGRYGKDQFLTTKLWKRTSKEKNTSTQKNRRVCCVASRSMSDSRKACWIKLLTDLRTYLMTYLVSLTKSQNLIFQNGFSHYHNIIRQWKYTYRLSARLSFWWYPSWVEPTGSTNIRRTVVFSAILKHQEWFFASACHNWLSYTRDMPQPLITPSKPTYIIIHS